MICNKNNNIKCTEHIEDDIFCICSQCDNTPICTKCLFTNHNGHVIIQINNETITPILNEFSLTTIPKLEECMVNGKSLLDKLDNDLKELELKHISDLHSIKSIFIQLHDNLSTKEFDLQRQLITIFDENKKINLNAHSLFNNGNSIIQSFKSVQYNNNNNNNHNIEIAKYNHQSKQLLSNITNDLITSHSQYNEKQLVTFNNAISSVNESINSIFTIQPTRSNHFIQPPPPPPMMGSQIYKQQTPSSQPQPPIPPPTPQSITSQKKIKWGDRIYPIFSDGYTPYGAVTLAIDRLDSALTSKFTGVTGLILLNGFNQSLDYIPETITELYIFNIGLGSTSGSIPNHIKNLWFCDGFDQTITKGVIPSSVVSLFLCDICKPLTKQSIPSTVKNIYKVSSFKHSLIGMTNNSLPKEMAGYGSYEYV